ncbi:methyltransferase domain-containing protein [Tropicibacter sp. R16_0]|uniref:methyltransferase domain-containing protein n=1 Tax=Tropicibacter sp. R16_0 TaxID=2821102 RepID=UPI001ADD241E|nr:methyltransferase domain-containing protein [Tropicibacter sp. R16_0]MBO9452346.1 methyltransferase domain-containing protein [Tropicibacter sp. R16_0]
MRIPPQDTPKLVDSTARAAYRRRIQPDALFLHDAAIDEVQDRLSMVNRTFTAPAVVTPLPQVWGGAVPGAQVIQDAEVLELEPAAHDLVVHAMGLHWANDPVGQLIQCRRALKPDGLFLAVALGGETLHELRATLGQAEVEVSGGLSPRIAPMAEIRDLGGLLQRAGFALPVADNVDLRAEYRDIWHLMRDLRAMGEGNALHARLRHPTRRAVFQRAQELYHSSFATDLGRLPATFDLICLTGWSPDESQPKPLRPGSATARLADALKTKEGKLSD